MPTVAAKNHPDAKMHALQWLGKKHVMVKEMPRPCITDKAGPLAVCEHMKCMQLSVLQLLLMPSPAALRAACGRLPKACGGKAQRHGGAFCMYWRHSLRGRVQDASCWWRSCLWISCATSETEGCTSTLDPHPLHIGMQAHTVLPPPPGGGGGRGGRGAAGGGEGGWGGGEGGLNPTWWGEVGTTIISWCSTRLGETAVV
mgnify:CR=1 FL=1